MRRPKLFIGPMSLNIIDTAIEFANNEDFLLGLIPSRRQVEYDGGYVNNWTTFQFANYIKARTNNIVIQRDHGSCWQGNEKDDGRHSLLHDTFSGFDLIHIDPWKKFKDIDDAAKQTAEYIRYCDMLRDDCRYEVGTEEAIRKYSPEELDMFLNKLEDDLDYLFEQIDYAVIQSGTGIVGTQNIGKFDEERCAKMIEVCKKHSLRSKEHNGDYLKTEQVTKRFELGLDGINIAPEFGVLETRCILEELDDIEPLFDLCYKSRKWVKWLPKDFQLTESNKEDIITVCGHYVFANEKFPELIRGIPDMQKKIKLAVYNKIMELKCAIE